MHPTAIAALNEVHEIRKTTSKKDAPVRQAEICAAFAPVLLKAITENVTDLANDAYGSVFITETLLAPIKDDKSAAIAAVAEFAGSSAEKPEDVSAYAQRALKTLAQGGHFNPKTKSVEAVEPSLGFAKLLWDQLKDHVIDWAVGDAGFVIVGLLEGGEWDGTDKLVKKLKGEKKKLEEAAAKGAKGAKVILEKL